MNYSVSLDKELWVVKSETWEIPIFAQPATDSEGEDVWIILAAVSLFRPQHLTLDQILRPISLSAEPDRWVVAEADFKKIATKAAGVTPRYYFKKAGDESESSEVTIETEPDSPEPDDAFIREVWQRSQIAKYPVFKLIWRAVVDGIAHRLILDNKPVDLGWFKIHAVPFRSNWKHNLLMKHPKLRAYFSGMSAVVRQAQMKLHGVVSDLFRTDNMAVRCKDGRTTFRWSIEVETTSEWLKYIDEVEQQRLRGATPEAYLHRWGTIVSRLKQNGTINALLAQFVDEISRPAGEPLQGSNGRGQRLVPFVASGSSRPANLDRVDIPLILDSSETQIRGPSDDKTQDQKVKKVPKSLPVLRPSLDDMRAARRNVSRGTGDGAAGVHVPAAAGDS